MAAAPFFNVRSWFAEQLGCSPAELELREDPDFYVSGMEVGVYLRDEVAVGRVMITGALMEMSEKPEYRRVTAEWGERQTATVEIGLGQRLAW